MITVTVRKQGGAAIMTIPSDILKMLDIRVGAALELDVTKKAFTAHPINIKSHKRYSLAELLKGVRPKEMAVLNTKTAWAREGKSVGRESA